LGVARRGAWRVGQKRLPLVGGGGGGVGVVGQGVVKRQVPRTTRDRRVEEGHVHDQKNPTDSNSETHLAGGSAGVKWCRGQQVAVCMRMRGAEELQWENPERGGVRQAWQCNNPTRGQLSC